MEKIRDGRQMTKVFAEHTNAKELAEIMSDFVNSYSLDTQGFIDGFKEVDTQQMNEAQKRMTEIVMLWLVKLNFFKGKNWYDLRVEYSVNIAEKLVGLFKDILPTYVGEYSGLCSDISDYSGRPYAGIEVPFGVIFVETMGRQHRTLQQSFSSICFRWIAQLEDEAIQTALKPIADEFYEKWYRTPMI